MSEYLSTLESAISDVGYWRWWTDKGMPEYFQVEFGGTQLWTPTTAEVGHHSGLIAIRFHEPRLINFLTMSSSVPPDWPEKLHRDEMESINLRGDEFTFSSGDRCAKILSRAVQVRSHPGTPGTSPSPAADEAFLALGAYAAGLIVIAESISVLTHFGELDEAAVISSHEKWWEYWREYWKRKRTKKPMPEDYACECTIPSRDL